MPISFSKAEFKSSMEFTSWLVFYDENSLPRLVQRYSAKSLIGGHNNFGWRSWCGFLRNGLWMINKIHQKCTNLASGCGFITTSNSSGMLLQQKKAQEHDYHVLRCWTINCPAGWDLVLEDCFEEMRTGYQELASTGKPAPDEIGNCRWNRIRYCWSWTLWNESRLALLRSDQEDYKEVLESLNWNVVMAEGNWQSKLITFCNGMNETEGWY